MKIQFGLREVFGLIIRSIEFGKYDNAIAICNDAIRQLEEEDAKEAKGDDAIPE